MEGGGRIKEGGRPGKGEGGRGGKGGGVGVRERTKDFLRDNLKRSHAIMFTVHRAQVTINSFIDATYFHSSFKNSIA